MTSNADAKFAREAWIRALQRTADIEKDPKLTLPVLIDRQAREFGERSALESPAGSLSYRALASRTHQYARWAIDQHLLPGDVAALFMPNCAEYVAAWLGLTRIGVTVALLNTRLSGGALLHSIEISRAKLMLVGAELAPALAAVRGRLSRKLNVWVDADSALNFVPLAPALGQFRAEPLTEREQTTPTLDATALYIYTSGTTGLPKAAKVTHYRLMRWSQWFAGLLDARPEDRMYNCLPLYHSVGGVVAIGALLAGGGAVVIPARFSASDFWREVRSERCTLFQYIGELCRYLVNTPPQPREAEHSLRIACGNGLRPEVWATFKARFAIPRILEYYASTEGNFSLYNCEGKPGAIGRIPSFLAHRLPVALLRFDSNAGEPVRNQAGFCERCGVDEVGEAVGLIPPNDERAGRFEGYADIEATQRKVLRHVFKAQDTWYRTGDLMRRDAAGFYYFVDRVGDTYRWKGENVSTAEVQSVLGAAAGVRESVVFGVQVPNCDGRAGMAALVVDDQFELEAFRVHIARQLPSYARPVFLRLMSSLESTGTFKPRKQDLERSGFDPSQITDPLYLYDPRADAYVPLDLRRHSALAAGEIRL